MCYKAVFYWNYKLMTFFRVLGNLHLLYLYKNECCLSLMQSYYYSSNCNELCACPGRFLKRKGLGWWLDGKEGGEVWSILELCFSIFKWEDKINSRKWGIKGLTSKVVHKLMISISIIEKNGLAQICICNCVVKETVEWEGANNF